jgi:hypothetical protein
MILKHRRLCGPVLALVTAAIAVPSASAREGGQFLNSRPAHGSGGLGPVPAQVRVVQAPAISGFGWGDAGIGAGAGLALAILGGGGAVVLRSRRRQGRPTTA